MLRWKRVLRGPQKATQQVAVRHRPRRRRPLCPRVQACLRPILEKLRTRLLPASRAVSRRGMRALQHEEHLSAASRRDDLLRPGHGMLLQRDLRGLLRAETEMQGGGCQKGDLRVLLRNQEVRQELLRQERTLLWRQELLHQRRGMLWRTVLQEEEGLLQWEVLRGRRGMLWRSQLLRAERVVPSQEDGNHLQRPNVQADLHARQSMRSELLRDRLQLRQRSVRALTCRSSFLSSSS